MKPHEETWRVHYRSADHNTCVRVVGAGDTVADVTHIIVADVSRNTPGQDARLRLAAKAPEMARLLLRRPCIDCGLAEDEDKLHAHGCAVDAVLREAGVL
jgi:hypothetical protein